MPSEALFHQCNTKKKRQSRVICVSEASLRAASENVKQTKNALKPHLNVSISGSYIGDATLMSRRGRLLSVTERVRPKVLGTNGWKARESAKRKLQERGKNPLCMLAFYKRIPLNAVLCISSIGSG